MGVTEHVGEEEILRVTAAANPKELAAVISHAIYDNNKPVMRAIGAGAVNQAFKAYIIARGYVATRGVDLYLKGGFATVNGDSGEVSAVTMQVIPM